MKAPEVGCGIRTSAHSSSTSGIELPVGSGQPYQGSKSTFFTSPTLRVRHVNLKMETPSSTYSQASTVALRVG